MRRMLLAGLGLASVGGVAIGQSPAARFGRVQALTPADAAVVARGQMPTTQPNPPPAGAASQPGGTVLGAPRLFGPGPSVTEQRAAQPGVVTGVPVPAGFAPPPPTFAGPPYPADGGFFPQPAAEAPLYGGEVGPSAAMTSQLNKWYLNAEYLVWFTRSSSLPALVTTSAPAFDGILGRGDTRVLYGNRTTGNTEHNGGRFTAGYWFGTEQRWGIETNIFFLTTDRERFTANSGQFPVLARPFFNLNANEQSAETVASPRRGATGSVAVESESSLWGADLNLRRFVTKTSCARLDFLAGLRYLSLEEGLTINESYTRDETQDAEMVAGLPVSGTVFDSFRTTNRFYGGQLGFTGEVRRGRWFSNLTAKVGFGTVFQSVNINGGQTATLADGTRAAFQGGLLALPGANIGDFKRNEFAVLPEVGLNVGYFLTPRLRVYVGYNFLYLSSVLRSGDQIDPNLDVTRIPFFTAQATNQPGIINATRLPQVRPVPTFKETDFFAQGVNLGLQFSW
jgi:Putative beta barrel porin-7 (BBP7)